MQGLLDLMLVEEEGRRGSKGMGHLQTHLKIRLSYPGSPGGYQGGTSLNYSTCMLYMFRLLPRSCTTGVPTCLQLYI